MKKKILFMVINMNVGGTEKALLNMIKEMPDNDYEITILMLEKYGGFLDSIPGNVKVEYVDGYQEIKELLNPPPLEVVKGFLRTGRLFKAAGFFTASLLSKLLNDKSLLMKYALKSVPGLKVEYDIAVAYAGPMDLISFFVAKKIKADRKIQWIHFDVTKIGFNDKFAGKMYRNYNQVFVVSNEAREKLLAKIPWITEKTTVFKNIISSSIIYHQSSLIQGFNDKFDGIRILTVGRLTNEKGQDLAIKAMAQLVADGYKVRWYCIGDGMCRQEYESLIKNYKLSNHFKLLGEIPNPYPFMSECDIYVQPSRYEGFCITILEAKLFNKPIVATHVNGVNEQIVQNKTGIIVKINESDIYKGVKKIIEDKSVRVRLKDNLQSENTIASNKNVNPFEKVSL
ncbi:glycosyltransferase [Evansella sp. LMS18]|uniref:glycosyltransferase n=1 Tax=Evansella sp. LMS18 TaxID=2924033 RepID=UPI0020D00BDD|nr:glycosyltransferase [Evansella sp. LMS18]UTR10572.1 glycosyltransferase [Evansella sp. LMS18]